MRTFASGAIRDDNDCKGRCDLLPLDIITQIHDDKILSFIHKFKSSGDIQHLIDLLKVELANDMHTALLDVSDRFALGAVKYGDDNWQKGIPANVYIIGEVILMKIIVQLMCGMLCVVFGRVSICHL